MTEVYSSRAPHWASSSGLLTCAAAGSSPLRQVQHRPRIKHHARFHFPVRDDVRLQGQPGNRRLGYLPHSVAMGSPPIGSRGIFPSKSWMWSRTPARRPSTRRIALGMTICPLEESVTHTCDLPCVAYLTRNIVRRTDRRVKEEPRNGCISDWGRVWESVPGNIEAVTHNRHANGSACAHTLAAKFPWPIPMRPITGRHRTDQFDRLSADRLHLGMQLSCKEGTQLELFPSHCPYCHPAVTPSQPSSHVPRVSATTLPCPLPTPETAPRPPGRLARCRQWTETAPARVPAPRAPEHRATSHPIT